MLNDEESALNLSCYATLLHCQPSWRQLCLENFCLESGLKQDLGQNVILDNYHRTPLVGVSDPGCYLVLALQIAAMRETTGTCVKHCHSAL